MSIRRAKKRKHIANDARIKACLRRFDDNVYTRVDFLKAVSHITGAHSCNMYRPTRKQHYAQLGCLHDPANVQQMYSKYT